MSAKDCGPIKSRRYLALLAAQTPWVPAARLLGAWPRGDGDVELRCWRDTGSGNVRLGVWVLDPALGPVLTRRAIRLRHAEVVELGEVLADTATPRGAP